MIQILAHRGLDPDKKNYFMESSLEAFNDQLKRGFGLEFDIQITKDREIVIFHDKFLIINGERVNISDINLKDVLNYDYEGCHITTLNNLLSEIEKNNIICALHFKGYLQIVENIDLLLKNLESFSLKNLIIFDVKKETAKYIKSKNKEIKLAPSVAHLYDIERFNEYVDHTLITIDEAINNKCLYDWLWFDEWDREDSSFGDKKFYIEENFKKAKNVGLKIAIVSPELHRTSPNLLGGEKHQDAKSIENLKSRLEEIIKLEPDLICTDYPDLTFGWSKLNISSFNVPILFIIFNRPETTKKVFESIRLMKPSKLFVAADGPRADKIGEDVLCKKTRSVVNNIDWPCEVYTFFQDNNLGCHKAVPLAISWFFDNVEEGIILEDDCLANESFFMFCHELLNKYKSDENIMMISGDNFQNTTNQEYSYYFSKYANIWGWASWRRAWKKYSSDFSLFDDIQMKKEIDLSYFGRRQKKYWFGYYKKIKNGKIINWDAKWFLSVIYSGGKNITPTINLVQNIGFDDNATSTKDEKHLSVVSRAFSILKHPDNNVINFSADYFLFEKIYFKTFFQLLIFKIKTYFKI